MSTNQIQVNKSRDENQPIRAGYLEGVELKINEDSYPAVQQIKVDLFNLNEFLSVKYQNGSCSENVDHTGIHSTPVQFYSCILYIDSSP